MNERLFFVISGEHPTLPKAELKAVLEAEKCQFQMVKSVPKLLIVEAPRSCLEIVSFRSAMCRLSGIHILECSNDRPSIEKTIAETDLSGFLECGDSFSVRVVKAGAIPDVRSSEALEAFVGKIVKRAVHGISVNLVRPTKSLLGVVYDGCFILGLETYRRPSGSLALRRPRRRPVFHPSTMSPKLARCMVNLARPKRGDFVLDPFCGVGGLLIESSLIGCQTFGCDIALKKIQGSLTNLRYFSLEPEGMVLADARVLPFGKVQAIVTDPPYGTAASTHGSTTRELFRQFLNEAHETITAGGCICIGAPMKVEIESLGEDAGLDLLENHEIYVHRSLTREIAVFRRT